MDTRPINAALSVSVFNPTGNPGEYTFENAAFNNQADETGNGAIDVKVGYLLYIPSTNFNTGLAVPGVLHRYKFTEVTAVDAQTLNGTIVWDEVGEEGLEVPTNGAGCGLSEPSPNDRFGYAPSESIYPELLPDSAVQSVQTDLWNIVDQKESSSSGPTRSFKTTIGDASTLSFSISHNLTDLDVSVTVYELSTGSDIYPGIIRTGPDDIQLDFTYPIETNSHRVIVRS